MSGLSESQPRVSACVVHLRGDVGHSSVYLCRPCVPCVCLTQDTWISIERPFSSHVVCRGEINTGPGVGYVECRAVRSSGGTGGTVQYYCLLSTRRVTSVVCASASRQNRVRVKRNVSSSYTATEVRFASLCKRRTFVSATYDKVGCVDRSICAVGRFAYSTSNTRLHTQYYRPYPPRIM